MTTITMKEVAAFLLGEAPLDGFWFGERHPAGGFWWREHLRAALSAPATAPEQRMKELGAENEQLRKDAERYQWLAEYLVSDDESYDDAIVAATTVKEVDSVIDNAMKGTS